ncbi:MAG TPA: nucleotide pyrophosphohydrolase [Rhodanobacteraceae bacterium]|jgi:NTP pyrophosphatase (non-canonical NTP hydrolase)|nr:nucleotide pyrophosphohydrolase [Rhodanobacteraceae bacterium]
MVRETQAAVTSDLDALRESLRRFAAERDWDKFHSPKNLAAALSVEAAELLEHFQWLTESESAALPTEKRIEVSEELADVLLYLIRIADKLEIDLGLAAERKMLKNAEKYPVEKSKGKSTKYTEL